MIKKSLFASLVIAACLLPAPGAAEAALGGMRALEAGPIRVRMGLHTGAPTLVAEGYIGIDVHRGARVGALAHGGQVVLSPTTAALLDGRPLRDLGLHRLKDFEGATRLFQLGDGDFPPLRTPGSVDLPTPATRFQTGAARKESCRASDP